MLGELEDRVAAGDMTGGVELAHRFVSIAGNVGVTALVAALRELEGACKQGSAESSRSAMLRVRAELERAVIEIRDLRRRHAESLPPGPQSPARSGK
jgi:HPt (histidine-containing phosphotransfer) domain-containing protein